MDQLLTRYGFHFASLSVIKGTKLAPAAKVDAGQWSVEM
jgi:hypothetical protein